MTINISLPENLTIGGPKTFSSEEEESSSSCKRPNGKAPSEVDNHKKKKKTKKTKTCNMTDNDDGEEGQEAEKKEIINEGDDEEEQKEREEAKVQPEELKKDEGTWCINPVDLRFALYLSERNDTYNRVYV